MDDKIRNETLISYYNLFSDGDGARVLRDLKESLDGDCYRGVDTHATAYHSGRRSVYLDLVHAVEAGRVIVESDGKVEGQQEHAHDDFFASLGGSR